MTTIDELKELMKNLIQRQEDLTIKMDRTSSEIDKLKIGQEKTDEQLKKTDEQLKKTDEQLKRNAEELKISDERLTRKLDKLGMLVGNISNNQGEVAEEFFANSLKNELKIGKINFDYLLENVNLSTKKINDEFDILLINGNSLAMIEVKYKVHPKVIDTLDKKIEHLKMLPQYKNYKIYAGVAGFKVPKDVIKKAKKKGFFVLKREGKIIHEYVDDLIPA